MHDIRSKEKNSAKNRSEGKERNLKNIVRYATCDILHGHFESQKSPKNWLSVRGALGICNDVPN